MEKIVLNAQKRESGENVRDLRQSKVIPAVVYGHKQETISIKLNNSELLRVYRKARENHIVELDIDWTKIDVLFHEVQKNPVTEDFWHIDFYAVTKWEKVHTHIPLSFFWNSKAKTEHWAIIEELVKNIEVKCLVTDLVDSIEVDLSTLVNIWDVIRVSDLTVKNIEILNSKDEVVVVAWKPKNHEEETLSSSEEVTEETK